MSFLAIIVPFMTTRQRRAEQCIDLTAFPASGPRRRHAPTGGGGAVTRSVSVPQVPVAFLWWLQTREKT
ncbi:MAG: hypothetical protein ABIQ72_02250 [Usitatibacter sp.]